MLGGCDLNQNKYTSNTNTAFIEITPTPSLTPTKLVPSPTPRETNKTEKKDGITPTPRLTPTKLVASPTPAETNKTENTDDILNKLTDSIKEKFNLGMTRQSVNKVLSAMGIGDVSVTNNTSDEDNWDWGNVVLDTDDFSFSFDKNDCLYDIFIYGSEPTSLGLKVDDNINTMLKLYGSKYSLYHTDNDDVYEYIINRMYLRIYIESSKVEYWEVSKYIYTKK